MTFCLRNSIITMLDQVIFSDKEVDTVLDPNLNETLLNAIPDGFDYCEVVDKIKTAISQARTENLDELIAEQLPAIQEKEQVKAVIKVRDEYRTATGKAVFALSPFNSERININGLELYRNSFISDRPITDPFFEETKLYFDDETERWLTRIKNGLPKLISRFVIVGCLIVNASGPGKCQAFVVFLKGRADPLIFWDGVIGASELRRQTQFHQRGLSYARKDLYHESFLRALRLCKAVYFLSARCLTLEKVDNFLTTNKMTLDELLSM